MGKDHRGHPGGENKGEDPGLRKNLGNDEKRGEDITQDPDKIKEDVRVGHPNRNTDKDNDVGTPYA